MVFYLLLQGARANHHEQSQQRAPLVEDGGSGTEGDRYEEESSES